MSNFRIRWTTNAFATRLYNDFSPLTGMPCLRMSAPLSPFRRTKEFGRNLRRAGQRTVSVSYHTTMASTSGVYIVTSIPTPADCVHSALAVLSMPWLPSPSDGVQSDTLATQIEVEQTISSLLTQAIGSGAQPLLQKDQHLRFITGILKHPLHAGFTALDASRPWLLYWTVHSLALFEGELDQTARARVVDTLRACQNPDGGFGGGPGQISHLAPSYAAVSALCYMGQSGWDMIDR